MGVRTASTALAGPKKYVFSAFFANSMCLPHQLEKSLRTPMCNNPRNKNAYSFLIEHTKTVKSIFVFF
jgi:hypothetical protein